MLYRNTLKDVIVIVYSLRLILNMSVNWGIELWKHWPFLMLNKLGMGKPLEFSFQEITFIFVQCKANLAKSSFNLTSLK